MFKVTDRVAVPSRGYSGTIVEDRTNEDGSKDYNVEYFVPNSLKGTYKTWWPEAYLTREAA